MSSRIINKGIPAPRIVIPNDEVIVDLQIMKSGNVQLQAPRVHPRDVIKLLHGIIVDLQFAHFQKEEAPTDIPPTGIHSV